MSQPMSEQVREVFDSYPEPVRLPLLELRELIFCVAGETEGVGPLTETLKWGQPSYATEESGSGTALRLHRFGVQRLGVFVNCQTTLIGTFRGLFPDLAYEKNRAIVLSPDAPLPVEPLSLFIEMALTYKLRR